MTMTTAPTFDDLLHTLEWLSSDTFEQNEAYVSRSTGHIFWVSDVEEDLPEDLEDGTKYVAVPHKRDLDLGKKLALDFVRQAMPTHYREVAGFFSKRGAYRRFKGLLENENKIEDWYSFEEAAVKRALCEWITENDLPIPLPEDDRA